jgi:hypothetical protein
MENLIYSIQNGVIGQIWGALQVLIGIVFVVLVGMIVYIKTRIHELDTLDKKRYADHFIKPEAPVVTNPNMERWNKISTMFMSPNESDWRVAVIEADSMLDEFIATLGYPGSNMGERMKNMDRRYFPTLDLAWDAHKIRNRIAHDGMNYHLSDRDKEIARKNYEFIFKDAKLI